MEVFPINILVSQLTQVIYLTCHNRASTAFELQSHFMLLISFFSRLHSGKIIFWGKLDALIGKQVGPLKLWHEQGSVTKTFAVDFSPPSLLLWSRAQGLSSKTPWSLLCFNFLPPVFLSSFSLPFTWNGAPLTQGQC